MEFIFLLVILALYFIPSIIGFMRNHPSAIGILIVNLFLGWSIIFWFVCFVWAFCGSKQSAPNITVINSNSTQPNIPPLPFKD